jgi:hypothetical protein
MMEVGLGHWTPWIPSRKENLRTYIFITRGRKEQLPGSTDGNLYRSTEIPFLTPLKLILRSTQEVARGALRKSACLISTALLFTWL